MEPPLQHSHGRHYDESESDPHNAGLHTVLEGHVHNEDDQHHGEKKSVIKKVKAKAKKLKDTITKHGHGHGHEHDHHDEEDDNDDNDDEEMVDDPEVHGAPIYESTAIRSGLTGPDAALAHPGGNLERPSVLAEDRYATHSDIVDPPVRPFGQWQEEDRQGAPPPLSTRTYEPISTEQSRDSGQDVNQDRSWVKIGKDTGMEVDPHGPGRTGVTSSNYESKVTDPTHTGGQEAGITPILRSFGKMGIYDESKPSGEEEHKTYSGSHDQFAPETVPKNFDPNHPEDMPRDTVAGKPSSKGSSYAEKITSATSAVAEKATAAKDAIASKLGYSGERGTGAETTKPASATEYAHKIAETVTETLAPVYDKVADAGSSVMSKMQGTGTGTGTREGAEISETRRIPAAGVSVKEYLVERLRPGDEDKALSEAITQAFNRGKDVETEKKSVEDRDQAMGRVTESEEVRRRLGTDREEQHSSNVSADKGVVDRLRGAVGSWFGGKGNTPEGSLGTSYVTDEGLSSSAAGGDGDGDGNGNRDGGNAGGRLQ